MNREEWLNEAARRFCKDFLFHEDLDVHVSVGWPSRGGLSTKKRVIGQCWKPETSKDGKSHIFISPMLVEPTVVLATLLHEMIHAFDRCESGHKGLFIEMARKVGLEKPWTATTAGFDLQQRLSILADEVPAENVAQIQCGLLVSGRSWCDYVSWCGGMPMWTKRVFPDPAWQDAIVEAVRAFEATAAEMVATYTERTAGLPATERTSYDLEMVI